MHPPAVVVAVIVVILQQWPNYQHRENAFTNELTIKSSAYKSLYSEVGVSEWVGDFVFWP